LQNGNKEKDRKNKKEQLLQNGYKEKERNNKKKRGGMAELANASVAHPRVKWPAIKWFYH
jgi:hypothetical protein